MGYAYAGWQKASPVDKVQVIGWGNKHCVVIKFLTLVLEPCDSGQSSDQHLDAYNMFSL